MRTIEHMAMFVVKSTHIKINSQVMDLSIWSTTMYLEAVVSKERASLLQRQLVIIVRDGSKLVTF